MIETRDAISLWNSMGMRGSGSVGMDIVAEI